jgi:hypothetical protein
MSEFRAYRINRDGWGMGGFLCPPGHWNHFYVLEEYTSPRGRKVIGSFQLEYVFDVAAHADSGIKTQALRIMTDAPLADSDLWERYVYGYYRNMYLPEDGSLRADDLIRDSEHSLPAERHAAVASIRQYFPGHQPRLDLITDPGTGYGSWPCSKCGLRVQYEAREDALCVVRNTGPGWVRDPVCDHGGPHLM